jgi:K+-transporting ATPase ATPase A chain
MLLGLNVQNFVSAATGIAALLAMVRGLSSKGSDLLGNFWVDLTRATLYVLLPLFDRVCSAVCITGCCAEL